jgi:hypothetical protein
MTKTENMKNAAYMLEKRSAMLLDQARMEGEVPASVEKFMELLHTETFNKEFMNCDSAEAVKELLDRNGIDFTMEEIDAILIAVGNTLIKLEENDGELTEEDLEQVAGGWSWGGFFKGIALGVASMVVMIGITAACVAATVGTGGAAAPLAGVTIAAAAKFIGVTVGSAAAIGGVMGGAMEL